MSSAESELYTKVSGIIAADTGAGGLAEASGTALIRVVARKDDPNIDRNNTNWPRLFFQADPVAEDKFGIGTYTINYRLYLEVNRDVGFAGMDAIVARMRVKLHRVALGTGTDWAFSTAQIRRVITLQSGGVEMYRTFQCFTTAAFTGGT